VGFLFGAIPMIMTVEMFREILRAASKTQRDFMDEAAKRVPKAKAKDLPLH
jgi:hypothetical protein